VRIILFHRKFRRFHGGHLKVWHYFNHVLAAPGFDARVLFDIDSSWDSSNPWSEARERVAESTDHLDPAALFVAGRDWQRLEGLGLLDRDLPVLNLIQHVRHAEDWSIQSSYLGRKAIRLCVGAEVAEVVTSAGSVGPTVVIPNGIDVAIVPDPTAHPRPTDLLIAGLKQPVLAVSVADRLDAPGRTIEVLTDYVPRETFLTAMRSARVTLFLPNLEEGFFLPALEGMAVGTLVVCPDCVGNRSFCLPGVNAFRPNYRFDEVVRATETALTLPPTEVARIMANAADTARQHSLDAEREAFRRVLLDLDALWASA
jgi:glycosyltransferase involved in cell wall biosynthesis